MLTNKSETAQNRWESTHTHTHTHTHNLEDYNKIKYKDT